MTARPLSRRRIEVFPYGFSMANGAARPVMIFKDKTAQHALPVWVHPLDATMALHDHAQTPIDPHGVSKALLEKLGYEARTCDFNELAVHRQYVTVGFTCRFDTVNVRVRADHAMSFCLAVRTRFFSTREFMARCRALDGTFEEMNEYTDGAMVPPGSADDQGHENGTKTPSYMM